MDVKRPRTVGGQGRNARPYRPDKARNVTILLLWAIALSTQVVICLWRPVRTGPYAGRT